MMLSEHPPDTVHKKRDTAAETACFRILMLSTIHSWGPMQYSTETVQGE